MSATAKGYESNAAGRRGLGALMLAVGLLGATTVQASIPSLVTIDGTGAGCAMAGVWHAAERRCEFNVGQEVGGIDVRADDVIVDCADAGVFAFYGNREFGITVRNRSGVTIRNCYVEGFRDGIVFENSHDGRIEDNVVSGSNTGGIVLTGSHRNHVVGTDSGNNDFLIVMGSADDNVIRGNNSADQNGMVISNSTGNTFRFNSMEPTATFGVSITNSSNNLFESNGVYFNSEAGGEFAFSIAGGEGNRIADSTFENAFEGIKIREESTVTFEGNRVKGVDTPVDVRSSDSVTFVGNEIICGRESDLSTSLDECVTVTDTSGARFSGNVVTAPRRPEDVEEYGVTGTAIAIYGGTENTIDGTIFEHWLRAVSIEDATRTSVYLNEFRDGETGIFASGADDIFVLGNTMEGNLWDMNVVGSERAAIAWNAGQNGAVGIGVTYSKGAVVYANDMRGYEVSGMLLAGMSDGSVAENTVQGSEFGIGLVASDENRVGRNELSGNGTGMYVHGAQNVVRGNVANDNHGFGIVDVSSGDWTAGTANRYRRNRCAGNGEGGSQPGGLCHE